MPVVFDDDVSGSGSASLGGVVNVLFWSLDLITAGPEVRMTPPFSVDRLLRVGFIALGDNFDGGTGTSEDHWDEPTWINYEHARWTPDPSTDGSGNFNSQLASIIRWSLSPDTTAHLHVFAA